jgi:hypothetical protein
MNRFFLTLLALLTGLAVPSSGVNARACSACAAEIGAPAAIRGASAIAAQQAASRALPVAPVTRRLRIPLPLRASLSLATPAVHIGIDRAHT